MAVFLRWPYRQVLVLHIRTNIIDYSNCQVSKNNYYWKNPLWLFWKVCTLSSISMCNSKVHWSQKIDLTSLPLHQQIYGQGWFSFSSPAIYNIIWIYMNLHLHDYCTRWIIIFSYRGLEYTQEQLFTHNEQCRHFIIVSRLSLTLEKGMVYRFRLSLSQSPGIHQVLHCC